MSRTPSFVGFTFWWQDQINPGVQGNTTDPRQVSTSMSGELQAALKIAGVFMAGITRGNRIEGKM